MGPDQAGTRWTGEQSPRVRSPLSSQRACEALSVVVTWGLQTPARSPDGSAGQVPGEEPDMEMTPSTPCWEGPSQMRRAQPHRGPWETRQSPPQPLPTATLRPASLGREI